MSNRSRNAYFPNVIQFHLINKNQLSEKTRSKEYEKNIQNTIIRSYEQLRYVFTFLSFVIKEKQSLHLKE